MTKDQKVALEKLADQTTSIDQLNAIGALAKTLTNAKTDASTNPNTPKNDLAAAKTVANKTIDQLKNLSDVQKSLYKQLINVSTTSNGINRLVEVAKFQDSEQAQPSEANANPAETSSSSSSSTPKSSRDTSLDNTGYAGGGVQPGTETGKTQADSTNSTSDSAKKSSDQQTPDPAKSSSEQQGSSDDSTSTQSADPNSTNNTGSEKMAQTGVKHVSFRNWLSQLLHF